MNGIIEITSTNINWYRKFRVKIVEGLDEQKECSVDEALEIAKNLGLNLILIKQGFNSNGNIIPSIVKIIDYGKYLYEQKKKDKLNAKLQRANAQKIKEVKFHTRIGDNDYEYKLNHIKEFLNDGNIVNCQIILRGAEKYNKDYINQFIHKLENDLNAFAVFIKKFNFQGNIISCVLGKMRDEK